MAKDERFSGEELRTVLRDAAHRDARETPQPEGYSRAEVETAAQEAGIREGPLREALTSLRRRRGFRSAAVIVCLGAAAAMAAVLFLPQGTFGGWRRGSLLLHNEHRHRPYTFELLVPRQPSLEHNRAVAGRRRAEDYCVSKRIRLEPRSKTWVRLDAEPERLNQVWVRVYQGPRLHRSALFTLPAGVEIDRKGRLDQKGIGSPHMHPAPDPSDRTIAPCPQSSTSAGGKNHD